MAETIRIISVNGAKSLIDLYTAKFLCFYGFILWIVYILRFYTYNIGQGCVNLYTFFFKN